MSHPEGDAPDDDPLIGVLMRLAQADFSARVPRSYDGGRQDTLAFLVNTVSEELARVVGETRENEATLHKAVETFAEVLSAHAAADFGARAPRTEDGSPLDVLAYMINNTGAETGRLFEERNRAFEELSEAKETEAVSRARGAFLANVSHELRTPLTLILGPLQRLLTDPAAALSESSRAELAIVMRNASRLARMVNDLLDFTRAEEGKLAVRWQRVDVHALVGDTVRDLQPIASEREVSLGVTLSGPAELAVDRRMFEKITVNLVSNALKFTGLGGRVDVACRTTDTTLVLSVADSGIGIAPEDTTRVFERFHQVDSSQSRRFEGSGLGLSLVREFCHAMGGEVSVQSDLGVGSTFEVHLPLRNVTSADVLPADADAAAPDRHAAEIARLSRAEPTHVSNAEAAEGRPFLLLVEDNADMRRYLVDVLGDEFEVQVTADGQYALDALEERTPDVIVSDVMMPRLDGLALVARVKADPRFRSVPIVLLTARAGSDSAVEGLDVGADDYLAKPFQPLELKARVRAAARLRQTTKDLAITLDELQVTKTLVLRMGQVTLAANMLGQACAALSPLLPQPLPEAAAAMLQRLAHVESLCRSPQPGDACDFLEVIASALGLPAPDAAPVMIPSDRSSALRALQLLLDEVGIASDGHCTIQVDPVDSEGRRTLRLEGPRGRSSAPDFSAPLPPSASLTALERAAAQLFLQARGVECSAEIVTSRLVVRLVVD